MDAVGGFDLDDLLPSPLPSTVPGEQDDAGANPAHSADGPAPGQRVGRYLTEEVLGRGGMGLVLRARDDLLQRDVALKVILPQYLATDATAGFRFLREAEIVARLEHPHIIRVLDAGLDAGVAYLAFEYKRGETYGSIRDRGPLRPERAVDLMIPILSALACAHTFGVVHGDLKPSNLLLSKDYAGREHPWVLDFGVSFFSDIDAGLDPTRKRVTGTPGYLAPEWLESSEVDGRADGFSLGCVLYEMLAGKGPFAGLMRLSQAVAAAQARSYPAITAVSEATGELGAIIDRSLAPDPDERFETLRDMARALLPHASTAVQLHYAGEF
jgi:serine/threonine-protein kinase